MDDTYKEVQRKLRQQQMMNDQELRIRKGERLVDGRYEELQEESGISLGSRILLFVVCIMLFSCYLYGGQDVKKGAMMAWSEMTGQFSQLEEERPAVRQVMHYIRKARDEVKELTNTYRNQEPDEVPAVK